VLEAEMGGHPGYEKHDNSGDRPGTAGTGPSSRGCCRNIKNECPCLTAGLSRCIP
jgi:hypothetical protein